jgi:hypothetical protein
MDRQRRAWALSCDTGGPGVLHSARLHSRAMDAAGVRDRPLPLRLAPFRSRTGRDNALLPNESICNHGGEELHLYPHLISIIEVAELSMAILAGCCKDFRTRLLDLIHFHRGGFHPEVEGVLAEGDGSTASAPCPLFSYSSRRMSGNSEARYRTLLGLSRLEPGQPP